MPPDGSWLGVYVFTPHYQAVSLAVKPSRKDPHEVMALVRLHAPGVPKRLFDTIIPLLPQRFDGFASFIRFPSILSGCGDVGSAAVVLDLTRVGGRYFPAVLPRTLSHAALLEYVTPMTADDPLPLTFYVGCRTHPGHLRPKLPSMTVMW